MLSGNEGNTNVIRNLKIWKNRINLKNKTKQTKQVKETDRNEGSPPLPHKKDEDDTKNYLFYFPTKKGEADT